MSLVAVAIAYLIQIFIIWLAVMISSHFVAHNVEAKRSLLLAFLAYFIPPFLFSLVNFSIPFAGIIIPLLLWIVLSELLLRNETFGNRIKVAIVAFVIYFVMQWFGLAGLIQGFLG